MERVTPNLMISVQVKEIVRASGTGVMNCAEITGNVRINWNDVGTLICEFEFQVVILLDAFVRLSLINYQPAVPATNN